MNPLALAGLGFATSSLSSLFGYNQQQAEVNQANKAIKARNQFAMQEWQYGEQMRQIQNQQARALYDMRVQQYDLQKELDLDAYSEFYEDSQLAFDRRVMDAVRKNFQSANQLAKYKGQAAVSRGRRGVEGTRSRRADQAAMLVTGMNQAARAERLTFEEQQMQKNIDRNRRRTDLRIKQAYNAIGPVPIDTPIAPRPMMGQMQSGPSTLGLLSSLGIDALGAVGTYGSLKAPDAGNVNMAQVFR